MRTPKTTNFQELNRKLYTIIDNKTFNNKTKETIIEMFNVAILLSTDNDIKLDFDDFKAILDHNKIFAGASHNENQSSIVETIKQSIINSSLNYNSINKISNMLIHFTIHPDLSLMNIADAMDKIYDLIYQDANVLWGTTTKKSINKNYVEVMILFTIN
jgi:cell division protein FtsZ